MVTDLPRIGDDPNRNYTLYDKDDDSVCLYASFDMHFMVIYNINNDSKVCCRTVIYWEEPLSSSGHPRDNLKLNNLIKGGGLISRVVLYTSLAGAMCSVLIKEDILHLEVPL